MKCLRNNRFWINFISFKTYLLVVILLSIIATSAYADTFLHVNATYNNSRDTVGRVKQFVELDEKMPVFIPPFTLHFNIHPLAESSYNIEIDFFELGPGYSYFHKEFNAAAGSWHKVEDLEVRGIKFDYSFAVIADTSDYQNIISLDSLTNFESTHFTTYIWRHTYADYKYNMRSGYFENVYDRYRKELGITRSSKVKFYIYPSSNNSPAINTYTGAGYDIANGSFHAVYNEKFDTALPRYIQRFVIYDTWGYSARCLVDGFASYFSDDRYVARKLIKEMSLSDIKSILLNEYPENAYQADIISGAFVWFIIDEYGFPLFKTLYRKSAPGKFAFEEVYHTSFDKILKLFIDYETSLKLTEPDAAYFSDIYTGQMWFEQALEYKIWLASQPRNNNYHLRMLGMIYFYTGNYVESESCYTALANNEPDNMQTSYLLSLSYIHNGKFDKAINLLQNIEDSLPQAAAMLAEIYLNRGNYAEAREKSNKSGRISDSWIALIEARLALADSSTARTDTILNTVLALAGNVISLAPGEARGYIDAAYALMFMRYYEDAENELQIALFVENRPYYLALTNLAFGRLYDLKKEYDKARIFYNQVVELNSGEYIKTLARNYLEKPFKLK